MSSLFMHHSQADTADYLTNSENASPFSQN